MAEIAAAKDPPPTPPTPIARTTAARSLLVAAALFLVSLLARTTNLEMVWNEGGPRIGPLDDLYHAHRISYSAAHPGRVLSFDPERGRSGAFCPWPPGYDLTAGVTARLLGARTGGDVLVRAIWFAPFVASLFVALLGGLLAWRWDAFTGFIGGAAVGFSPAYVEASRLGALDHHFLEPPLLLGILGALLLLRRATLDKPSSIAAYGGLFGLAILMALSVQPALIAAAGISAFAVIWWRSDALGARWAAGLGFLVASLGVFLYRAIQPGGYPDDEWFLGFPHAAVLLGAAAASVTSAMLLSRRVSLLRAALGALVVGALCAAAVPTALYAIVSGSRFFGGDPWLETIVEFQPLFFQGRKEVWTNLAKLGGGALLLIPFAVSAIRRGGDSRRTLALFAVFYLAAAVSSLRFLSLAATLLALIGAFSVGELRRQHRTLAGWAAALLLITPTLWVSVPLIQDPPPPVHEAALPAIRAATEIRNRDLPPGRVLSSWGWGHLFHLVGSRPVIVDGFGASIGRTDFENALGIILAGREDAVATYCRANGIRLLTLENPLQYLTVQAKAIGLPPGLFVETPELGPARIRPLMRSSFWWRAYFDRGRAVSDPAWSGGAFRHFRLIYVDPELSGGPRRFRGPAIQVWELVS